MGLISYLSGKFFAKEKNLILNPPKNGCVRRVFIKGVEFYAILQDGKYKYYKIVKERKCPDGINADYE